MQKQMTKIKKGMTRTVADLHLQPPFTEMILFLCFCLSILSSPHLSQPSSDSIDRPRLLLFPSLLLLPCPHPLNKNRLFSSGLRMFVSDRLPNKLEKDSFSSHLFPTKPCKNCNQLISNEWRQPDEHIGTLVYFLSCTNKGWRCELQHFTDLHWHNPVPANDHPTNSVNNTSASHRGDGTGFISDICGRFPGKRNLLDLKYHCFSV